MEDPDRGTQIWLGLYLAFAMISCHVEIRTGLLPMPDDMGVQLLI